MKTVDLDLPIEIEELRHILKVHGVVSASVFGSFARGSSSEKSDLDLLVSYREGVSLFDHFDLKEELAKKTGRNIDLISEKAVSKHLKPYIDKEKISLL